VVVVVEVVVGVVVIVVVQHPAEDPVLSRERIVDS